MASRKPRSFVVRYRLPPGGNPAESLPYQRRVDAIARLEAIRRTHAPRGVEGAVVESGLPPDILLHCEGHPPVAVGTRCDGCCRVVTRADARAAVAIS